MISIKYQAGTVDPSEYNWEEEFSFDGVIEPFIKMDVGKVRGLAIALERSEAEVAEVYEAGIKEGINRNKEEIETLQDRFRNGIKYDEDRNEYILVWTERELDIAKKEADEIMKFMKEPKTVK